MIDRSGKAAQCTEAPSMHQIALANNYGRMTIFPKKLPDSIRA